MPTSNEKIQTSSGEIIAGKRYGEISDSGWIEFDSHSDIVVQHDLQAVPTEVMVWLSRWNGTTHLSTRMLTPPCDNVTVGAMTITLVRWSEFQEAAAQRNCNRVKIQAVVGKNKNTYTVVGEVIRPIEGSFLDSLEKLD